MDYVNNGEYYLVARYQTESIEPIDLDRKWYYGGENQKQSRADIAAIDLITSKFNDEIELKTRMFENGYIKSMDVDLYIVHKSKYSSEEYINEYELIYKDSERTELITSLANARLKKEEITLFDVNNLLNKFITKAYYTKSFYSLVTSPWAKLDNEIKNQLMLVNKKKTEQSISNPEAPLKPNFSIKYKIRGRFTSYTNIRNMVALWNLYDNLVEEYKKDNPNCTDNELSVAVIKLYIEKLKATDERKAFTKELNTIADVNNIKGQMTLDMYSNDFKELNNNELVKEKSAEELLDNMCAEANELRNSPFDDNRLTIFVDKFGEEFVSRNVPEEVMATLTLEDRYRLGMMDYVAYKNEKREQEWKRK